MSLIFSSGITPTGVCDIILDNNRVVEKFIEFTGNIGTGVVGLVIGLDAALNLADKVKKAKKANKNC